MNINTSISATQQEILNDFQFDTNTYIGVKWLRLSSEIKDKRSLNGLIKKGIVQIVGHNKHAVLCSEFNYLLD